MSPVRTATRAAPLARAGRSRKPDAGRSRKPDASRSRRPDASRFHVVIFTIMVCGAMLGLLLVAEGLVMLDTQSLRSGNSGGTASAAPDEHAQDPAAAAADLSVSAEHLGDLRVRVEVRVTMNEQRRPLQRATVEATLDMVQMPGAHTQGPLELQEDGSEPGLYTTTTTVAMLGDYDIQVHMHEPVHAEATHRLAVEVLRPDG